MTQQEIDFNIHNSLINSLQKTREKQVRIAWSTIKLPNGATQDDDNHAGRDPMNLSPYACSGLSTRKNNRSPADL